MSKYLCSIIVALSVLPYGGCAKSEHISKTVGGEKIDTFSAVWYRDHERTSGYWAFQDEGALIIGEDTLEFIGKKNHIVIRDVKNIAYRKQGNDFANTWVVIDYKDENGVIKQAFFFDGGEMGWGGARGGTRKIFDVVQRLKQQ